MSFTVFDAHCDTIAKVLDENCSLRENTYMLDLERMRSFKGGYIQAFAAFVDKKEINETPFERVMALIRCYHREMEKNNDIAAHCQDVISITNALKSGKIATILSVEGGEAIEGSLEKLRELYKYGVRIMTLTWNYENEIADGIGEERGNGLTEFGKDVVSEMNKLGMLIDVSHLSVGGFWDILEKTSAPILATHSNAYALRNHPRNLSDEQIKAVIKNGGCIGVNFYSEFLSDGKCEICDIIRHIEYLAALGGENNIGLGSDFDGMDKLPCEMSSVSDIYKIFDELLRLGYPEETVRKIASGNFMRVLAGVLK